MKITDETWQVRCQDIAEKQELFDLADGLGLLHAFDSWGFRNDYNLLIGMCDGTLVSFEAPDYEEINYGESRQDIAAEQFRQLCGAHASQPA